LKISRTPKPKTLGVSVYEKCLACYFRGSTLDQSTGMESQVRRTETV
jgi:hypothetical protein